MATCRIFKDRIFKLKPKDRDPVYTAVAVMKEKLLVTDSGERNLQVFNLQDGKLICTLDGLESGPRGICVLSDTEFALCLGGKIVIMTLTSNDRVERVKTLDVGTGFRWCQSVGKWTPDNLLISGVRWKDMRMLCWAVVLIKEGRLDSTHDICEGYETHVTVKENTVYVSCLTWDCITAGVHAFDLLKPGQEPKFLYQHKELKQPGSIMADTDYVYVCDENSNKIHQITDNGQLVAIHTLSSSIYGMFYDDQHRLLYTTGGDNVISSYKMEYPHQVGVPVEILKMDDRSIHLFEEALKDGEETVHIIRIMVVGHLGVGKTTLVKRLLGQEVNISERCSTEGIDVHVNCFDVSLTTRAWTRRTKDSGQDYRLQRIVKVLNEQQTERGNVTNDVVVISSDEDSTDMFKTISSAVQDQDAEVPCHNSSGQDTGQDFSSVAGQQITTTHHPEQSTSHQQVKPSSGVDLTTLSESRPKTVAMIKLLKENSNKIKGTGQNSLLTIWDFAGQYVFYTTHQTFLTRRAIYLLVSDVSGQVTDVIADDCFFDSEGKITCKVHELVEVWLNSIHTCASSPEDGNPPVILVGTHVDKIVQNTSSEVGNDEGQTVMPGSRSGSSLGARSSIQDEEQIQRKKKSIFGNFIRHIQRIVSPGAKNPDPSPPVRHDVQTQEDKKQEICKIYFKEIRSYLKDKPTRFHLIDEDFAIDNTVVDSKLEDLKKKILDVASQQPYWGEKIPARWLLLEQKLMKLKAVGMKVISLEEVMKINKEGTVQIEKSEELDLFLRFLHETGTIIYFSIEILRENIVLDPTWLIDALKSLINAQPDLPKPSTSTHLSSSTDSVIPQKWSDFKEKGILSSELIDAVWTAEKYPELHAHKDHMLLIMEQLNIIARPRTFSEIGEEIENYFLTQCMPQQGSPREIISPEEDPLMVSTPVLCCVFT